ncbi:MAG: hypothetical protein GY811_04540 [Myxococcales bacterium]|nr:hypothetical protein [Myxococcales bacterium]
MAINIGTTYDNTTDPDDDHPYGSAKNETTPGALDGTPLEKAWFDDVLGMQQSLLKAAGIVPNGNPDTVQAAQYLQAIINTRWYALVDYAVGTKIVGSDGVTYVCATANGPASSVQDPVSEGAPRSIWLTEAASMFDMLNPVGAIYMSHSSTSPATLFGVGTWVRIKGKFIAGLDESDSSFNTVGETGGSKTHSHAATGLSVDGHAITIAQMPSHSHGYLHNTAYSNAGSGQTYEVNNSTQQTTDTGGDEEHDHGISGSVASVTAIPPYQVEYIWRRTA